jgi:hypothetical protein
MKIENTGEKKLFWMWINDSFRFENIRLNYLGKGYLFVFDNVKPNLWF